MDINISNQYLRAAFWGMMQRLTGKTCSVQSIPPKDRPILPRTEVFWELEDFLRKEPTTERYCIAFFAISVYEDRFLSGKNRKFGMAKAVRGIIDIIEEWEDSQPPRANIIPFPPRLPEVPS